MTEEDENMSNESGEYDKEKKSERLRENLADTKNAS